MNKKDVNEIRRRFRADRSNITHLYGCYVNAEKEIIARLDESMGLLQKEESEKYLILLAADSYDVPHRGKDGEFRAEEGAEVYRYFVCCICPVKSGKGGLGYDSEESRFRSLSAGQLINAPELGFLFPAFDERSTNIYGALYYSRSGKANHQEFVDGIFRTEPPMAAETQKETFHSVLSDSLEREGSFALVRDVHEKLSERIALHKESRDPEPLTMSLEEMDDVLGECGMSEEKREQFRERCEKEFGEGSVLRPGNLVSPSRMEIETPEIHIRLDTQFAELIKTRTIDGRKYLLIPADAGVEINGIHVDLPGENE